MKWLGLGRESLNSENMKAKAGSDQLIVFIAEENVSSLLKRTWIYLTLNTGRRSDVLLLLLLLLKPVRPSKGLVKLGTREGSRALSAIQGNQGEGRPHTKTM